MTEQPAGTPSLQDVLAVSQRAMEAAQAAATAAEAASASAEAAKGAALEKGIVLDDEMLARIGAASSAAWQGDMRALGVLQDETEAAAPGIGEQIAAAVEAGAEALTPDPGEEIIFPTFAHRLTGQGVRRRDWEGQ